MFDFLRLQCLLGKLTEEQLNRIVGVHITEEEHAELVSILQSRAGSYKQ